jgi:hypothetical protein
MALLLAGASTTGCPREPGRVVLSAQVEKSLVAKGDPLLKEALIRNSPLPFAVIARFDSPVFPEQSEFLADAGIPPVESTGSTALLVATAKEVTALFEARSLLSLRYLGSQASLSRLHPELEIALLRTFENRTETAPAGLLVRFRSPPDKREADAITAAGFLIETRSGIVWSIRGAMDRLPALLAIDEIIYVEAASKVRTK